MICLRSIVGGLKLEVFKFCVYLIMPVGAALWVINPTNNQWLLDRVSTKM
jgi:hypothetical protein